MTSFLVLIPNPFYQLMALDLHYTETSLDTVSDAVIYDRVAFQRRRQRLFEEQSNLLKMIKSNWHVGKWREHVITLIGQVMTCDFVC